MARVPLPLLPELPAAPLRPDGPLAVTRRIHRRRVRDYRALVKRVLHEARARHAAVRANSGHEIVLTYAPGGDYDDAQFRLEWARTRMCL